MILNVVSKTKHSKLKESPVAGPCTPRVEPAYGSRQQLTDDMDGQNLWTRITGPTGYM